MKRDNLIDEIMEMCFDYETLDKNVIKKEIDSKLSEVDFVENLIGTIHKKAKYSKNIDIVKVKKILLELDKIRWELEFEYRNCSCN